MAQQVLEWMKEELQRVEQKIEEQAAKIDDAIENNKPGKIIASYREEKKRLVDKKQDLWHQLSVLQIRLASPLGEVLAAARY